MTSGLPLPNLISKHLVRRHPMSVLHLHSRVPTSNRYTILKACLRSATIRKSKREWQILRQQAQLTEESSLIPGDVFVIEAVSSDIDYRSERDFGFYVGRRYTRQPTQNQYEYHKLYMLLTSKGFLDCA